MEPAPFILELKATPEEVMRGVEALEKYCRAQGAEEKAIHALMLSLEEIASNVVNHAFHCDPQQSFRVSFQRTGDRIVVEVRDRGPAFDPLQSHAQALEGDVDRPEGGWGIQLVRQSMDILQYLREGNENVLILSKHIKPEVP